MFHSFFIIFRYVFAVHRHYFYFISEYSDNDISLIVDTMNNMPRECLIWKTPKEVFFNLSLELTYINFQYSPKPFPAIECCT